MEKACELSSNLEALSKIRGQLRSDMENSPLRNEKAFVKELEKTYQSMWEEYLKKSIGRSREIKFEKSWGEVDKDSDLSIYEDYKL